MYCLKLRYSPLIRLFGIDKLTGAIKDSFYKFNAFLAIVWYDLISSVEDFHLGNETYSTSTFSRIIQIG